MENIVIPIPIYHSALVTSPTTLVEKDSCRESPGSDTKSVS